MPRSSSYSEPTTIDKQPPVCVDCGNPDAPYIVNLPQQGEIGWLCEDCNRQFEVNRSTGRNGIVNDSEPTTTVTWTHRSNKRGIAEVDLKTGKVLSNMTLEEPTTTDSGIDLDALFETSKVNDMMPSSYIRALIVRLRTVEAERDELKESLRTTRLEQANKAFQVDDLETKVRGLTEELAAIESRPE